MNLWIILKRDFLLDNVSAVIGNEKDISSVALLGGSGADFFIFVT